MAEAVVYARHDFIKEVFEACASGETRRVENLVNSKVKSPGGNGDQVSPSKWEFQEQGDEYNLLGQTPLHVAVEKGFVGIVRVLVEEMKVDVDITDAAGWTALHWACAARRELGEASVEMAKILVDAGAEVGAVTKDKGDSALHFAAANGHVGCVKLLVAQGANVNRANDEDATPVHVAAQRGNTVIIKLLNSNGGDMSRRNSTANRLDAMEELVAKSPDSVNLRNAAGELPSDVAGCEAAKDMVKPFKRAVNAVRAALKFGALGNLSSSPLSSPGVKSRSPLSSKFTRTPRSSVTK